MDNEMQLRLLPKMVNKKNPRKLPKYLENDLKVLIIENHSLK
jgi:hypothetical protein